MCDAVNQVRKLLRPVETFKALSQIQGNVLKQIQLLVGLFRKRVTVAVEYWCAESELPHKSY
jgi:hypothetical protein